MGAGDRIAELIKSLPASDLAELLDFAEFLASRRKADPRTAAPGSFLDAVEGLQIDAPPEYSTAFEQGLYGHRPPV